MKFSVAGFMLRSLICLDLSFVHGDRYVSMERNILIEGSFMGLARNLALEKFPGIHKDNPS